MSHGYGWVSCAVTRQPTHDPAMNPVTTLVTFGVSQFLADNVGMAATCADMSPKFPTNSAMDRNRARGTTRATCPRI